MIGFVDKYNQEHVFNYGANRINTGANAQQCYQILFEDFRVDQLILLIKESYPQLFDISTNLFIYDYCYYQDKIFIKNAVYNETFFVKISDVFNPTIDSMLSWDLLKNALSEENYKQLFSKDKNSSFNRDYSYHALRNEGYSIGSISTPERTLLSHPYGVSPFGASQPQPAQGGGFGLSQPQISQSFFSSASPRQESHSGNLGASQPQPVQVGGFPVSLENRGQINPFGASQPQPIQVGGFPVSLENRGQFNPFGASQPQLAQDGGFPVSLENRGQINPFGASQPQPAQDGGFGASFKNNDTLNRDYSYRNLMSQGYFVGHVSTPKRTLSSHPFGASQP